MNKKITLFMGLLLNFPFLAMAAGAEPGVSFSCRPSEIKQIETDVDAYLATIKIDPSWVIKKMDKKKGLLAYKLNTPENDTKTLDLYKMEKYHIQPEEVRKPISFSESRLVKTVSRKEIVLALFQNGRATQFTGENCSAQSFIDHVGVRQNTVLWAQNLDWGWPDGPAYWNEKFWTAGTPRSDVSVVDAFLDMFINQSAYGIGCYTASKMVMIQGVVDYYARVSRNPIALQKVIDRLATDNDPLVAIEPEKMWSFEEDFDMSKMDQPGKILVMQENVSPMNFVPGDWSYFYNTDAVSRMETGYEGSNAIYLGAERFGDYYNSNNHAYTYKETLDKVYQWRHGVFNRSDAKKKKPLSEENLKFLGRSPAHGGMLFTYRVHHDLFN